MKRIVLALTLVFGVVGTSNDAWAGKKGAEQEVVDPYAYPEFNPTNVADIDTFFANAKAPIVSIVDTRKKLDQSRKDLSVALEIAEDGSIAEGLASLQKKADGKIKRVMKGKMPALELTDAVPDNVRASVESVNKSLEFMELAFNDLKQLEPQVAELATQSVTMVANAPDTIKNAGISITKVPAALSTTKKNAKTVGDKRDELTKLLATVEGIQKDFEGAVP